MSQIRPTMHRDPVELDTRYISPKLRVETLLKSDGRCAHCGVRIVNGQFQADHIVRWSDGGRTEIGNLQALCLPCHSVKTRKADTPGAAKTKRMPKACLPRDPDEIEPSRIQGRGFNQGLTKGFDGKVRPRKQRQKSSQDGGEPRGDRSISGRSTNNNSTDLKQRLLAITSQSAPQRTKTMPNKRTTSSKWLAIHGTAEDAIDFALEQASTLHGERAEDFLTCYRQGDLEDWPEFYTWLKARRSHEKDFSHAE